MYKKIRRKDMNKKNPSMLSFIEDTPKQIHYNIENLHVLTETHFVVFCTQPKELM